ncbi:TlpA family protein disulfide reductase [bacterium]|nr:TlpA family protein disulfide reductase [bacterium]MBU1957990.1 TlpA family protein disulfide reductase [bacterium]
MGKIGNIIIGISGVLLLFTAFGFYTINNEKKVDEKKVFHSSSENQFRFKTIEGKNFNIEAFAKQFRVEGMEEKIVFLKVFGWDCKFCKKEIPELIQLKKDLPNTIEIIAVEAQQHSIEESKKYAKAYGINYHIVSGDDQEEFYTYLESTYGWSGVIPLTIVLGQGGKVLAFELGAKSYTLAELMKASLLRE